MEAPADLYPFCRVALRRRRFDADGAGLLRGRAAGDGGAVHHPAAAVPVAGAVHVLRLGAPDADHLQGARRPRRPVSYPQVRQVKIIVVRVRCRLVFVRTGIVYIGDLIIDQVR